VPAFLKGNLDDLRIYDRVLTDPEIAILAGRATRITSIRTDGTNAVLTAEGGPPGGTYYVLSSANVTSPAMQWTPLATNQFDVSGNCVSTNTLDPSSPARFFMLQLP
jgi:hypothetical protein